MQQIIAFYDLSLYGKEITTREQRRLKARKTKKAAKKLLGKRHRREGKKQAEEDSQGRKA